MTDLTQTELTRLATVLGIEREVWGELWNDRIFDDCSGWVDCDPYINLPSPLSDSPRACMWEPFLMRELCVAEIFDVLDVTPWRDTTASLFRAFEAARPDWRNQ